MKKIKAVVVGASGYIGGEALRLLLGHPDVQLAAVTGHENAGKRVDEIQPNLRGFTVLSTRRRSPRTRTSTCSPCPTAGRWTSFRGSKGRSSTSRATSA
jgi:N-acetyl-gamma-glutamylphosphate reductase